MTAKRAKELIVWMKYQNGGCGVFGSQEPDFPNRTDTEDKILRDLVRLKDGGTTVAQVLYEIANGRVMVTMAADDLKRQLAKPNNGFTPLT